MQADGGTRTAAINGAFVALCMALNKHANVIGPPANVVTDSVAAISVGIVDDRPVLDLDYQEDSAATVDMNVVMTGRGQFVEVQGSGEEATFSQPQLDGLLALAQVGLKELAGLQSAFLARHLLTAQR